MFFAYPNDPNQIGQIIETAVAKINAQKQTVTTWKAMNSAGAFISRNIYENIDASTVFIADITILNFNVTYEIGYAIGQKKKILLVRNASLCVVLTLVDSFLRFPQRDKMTVFYVLVLVVHLCFIS